MAYSEFFFLIFEVEETTPEAEDFAFLTTPLLTWSLDTIEVRIAFG